MKTVTEVATAIENTLLRMLIVQTRQFGLCSQGCHIKQRMLIRQLAMNQIRVDTVTGIERDKYDCVGDTP